MDIITARFNGLLQRATRFWNAKAFQVVLAGCVMTSVNAVSIAQVACTGQASCSCQGCQSFMANCDSAGCQSCAPVAPGHAIPNYAAPSYPAPNYSAPYPVPGNDAGVPVQPSAPIQSSDPNYGTGVTPPQESITAPTPSGDQFGADAFQQPATPPMNSLASSLGATSGAAGIPDMIGDFFGGGYNYGFIGDGATVGVAGGDRRLKFAENNSPFPRNRIFFNYHHFHNAVRDVRGTDRNLDRYTFGLERLILDGRSSLEVRVPFSNTVSAGQDAFIGSTTDTEFGNLSLAVKRMLYQDQCSALSIGLGIVFPTGDDFQIVGDVVDNRFANDSVHLQPFIGYYHAPSRRCFTQFFAQLDFDTDGNDVTIAGISDNLQDQTLLFLDMSVGYWAYRNRCARYLRGIAPMIELHYSTSLDDQEYGAFEGVTLSGQTGLGPTLFVEDARRDVLNLTGGLFFELGSKASLKIGAVAPLRTGSDKLFDSEIGVQLSRRY